MKIILAIFILLFLLPSCEKEAKIVPQEIVYGQDVCERCKMMISEKVFSAQYLLPKGKVEKFDDIGCMFHYMSEDEYKRDKIIAFYVRDYKSNQWIAGQNAYYVWSSNIITPMGHGIVALGDRESAQLLAKENGGKVIVGMNEAVNWVLNQVEN